MTFLTEMQGEIERFFALGRDKEGVREPPQYRTNWRCERNRSLDVFVVLTRYMPLSPRQLLPTPSKSVPACGKDNKGH